MCMLCNQTSPSLTVAKASFNWTPPFRSDLTSEPCNCRPASHFSRKMYLKAACLFLSMSVNWDQVHAPAGRIHTVHLHGNRIAQAHRPPGMLAYQCRFRLVEAEAI